MAMNSATPGVETAVTKMKEKYPASPDQLIPLLQFMQSEVGYLPTAGMEAIAEYLKIPASHVYGVATFYSQFRFHPLGKNRITVCRGTACHVRGSARLLAELESDLKIKAGETTPDLQFSLETVACVGSCALAPLVVVNKKVHGKATSKKVRQIINQLRNAAPTEPSEPTEQPSAPLATEKEQKPPALRRPAQTPAPPPEKKRSSARGQRSRTGQKESRKTPRRAAAKKKKANKAAGKSRPPRLNLKAKPKPAAGGCDAPRSDTDQDTADQKIKK